MVGDSGIIYALDKWAYMVDGLKEEATTRGFGNIRPITTDITEPLPIHEQSIDVCLMSTVLHIFSLSKIEKTLFPEIRRILKPDGRVVVIECKKEDRPSGPPKHMRLSPQELEASTAKYGFKKTGLKDLGYNYMILFKIERPESWKVHP